MGQALRARRRAAIHAAIHAVALGLAAVALSACVFAVSFDRSRIAESGVGGAGGDETEGSVGGAGPSTGATAGGADAGACTEENIVATCGVDSTCRVLLCIGGACVESFTDLGTSCADDNGVVCDGKGACVEGHCADGVRDGDETGVDCGGTVCAPCAPPP